MYKVFLVVFCTLRLKLILALSNSARFCLDYL